MPWSVGHNVFASGRSPPVPLPGVFVDVVLVDFSSEVLNMIMDFDQCPHPLSALHVFDEHNPLVVPALEPLVSAAWDWVQGQDLGERIGYYSAREEDEIVPETPPLEEEPISTPRARTRARAATGGGDPAEKAAARKPRVTVANLAASLEQVTASLPAMMQRMEDLAVRQSQMEAHLASGPSKSSALQQPLGSLAIPGSSAAAPSSLVKEMPPPRSSLMKSSPALRNPSTTLATKAQVLELEAEKQVEENHLTRAVLEQSRALSALVAQISNGDPISDLGSSSMPRVPGCVLCTPSEVLQS
eukprot:Skav235936  [mRNA]  locus=scaffold4666:922:1824:- [translate_table: standard]